MNNDAGPRDWDEFYGAKKDDEPGRCGGSGMVAYWDGSAYAGEMCRGCVDCEGPDEPHDAACESELTSHGYTPCQCEERAKK